MTNAIARLIEIKAQMKALKNEEEGMKAALFLMMDDNKSDKIQIGEHMAERKLVVQPRLDTKKAKEMLGDNAPMNEVESIRLTLI